MFYKIKFPIFSFDINEKDLIAIIYQINGKNELTIRNLKLNKELFFYPLETSVLNVKIRFLNTEKAVCFDGNKIIYIDFIKNNISIIKHDIDNCTIIKDKIIAVSTKGEVFIINSKEDTLLLGLIDNYISTKEIYSSQLIDFSYEIGDVVIAYNTEFYFTNFTTANSGLINFHLKNTSKAKYLSVGNSLDFIGCIVEDHNKLISLSKNKSDLILNDILDIRNCACIKIIEKTDCIIIASNMGYLSILNMKSLSLIYSEKKHSHTIRDLKFDNELIYTSGDDGLIIKTDIGSLDLKKA
jgi:hypothetical protein